MSYDHSELTEGLKNALDVLIEEAEAKGPGRVLTRAERDAALWVSDREEGPRDLSVYGGPPRPTMTRQ